MPIWVLLGPDGLSASFLLSQCYYSDQQHLSSWTTGTILILIMFPTVYPQSQQSNPPSKYRTCVSLLQRLPVIPDSFRMRANVFIMSRKPYMTTLLLEHLFPSPSHCSTPAPLSSFLLPSYLSENTWH